MEINDKVIVSNKFIYKCVSGKIGVIKVIINEDGQIKCLVQFEFTDDLALHTGRSYGNNFESINNDCLWIYPEHLTVIESVDVLEYAQQTLEFVADEDSYDVIVMLIDEVKKLRLIINDITNTKTS